LIHSRLSSGLHVIVTELAMEISPAAALACWQTVKFRETVGMHPLRLHLPIFSSRISVMCRDMGTVALSRAVSQLLSRHVRARHALGCAVFSCVVHGSGRLSEQPLCPHAPGWPCPCLLQRSRGPACIRNSQVADLIWQGDSEAACAHGGWPAHVFKITRGSQSPVMAGLYLDSM
jgi:hypothetical protein